jgi:hypothetical protein
MNKMNWFQKIIVAILVAANLGFAAFIGGAYFYKIAHQVPQIQWLEAQKLKTVSELAVVQAEVELLSMNRAQALESLEAARADLDQAIMPDKSVWAWLKRIFN